MWDLYETIELPLCSVLAEMEAEGFLIDRGALVSFGEMLTPVSYTHLPSHSGRRPDIKLHLTV